ncbi:MAG: hypothetical protein R3F62_10510 [Planctomycetota bacterium]
MDALPPPEHVEPPRAGQLLQAALARGLITGAVGAGVSAFLAWTFHVYYVGFLALQGFFGGGILGALALYEAAVWGARPRPAPGRLALGCAGAWVLGAVLAYGALLQGIYLDAVLGGHGNEFASQDVAEFLLRTANDPAPLTALMLVVGALFASWLATRGTGVGVLEATLACCVGTVPLAAAVFLGSELCLHVLDRRFLFGTLSAGAALFPLTGWLGDRAVRRWAGAGVERARRRGALWRGLVVTVGVGAPLGLWAARAAHEARLDYRARYARALEEASAAFYRRDYARAARVCTDLEAKVDLGVLDAQEVRDMRATAAWWLGEPLPEPLEPATRAQLLAWDQAPDMRLERAELWLYREGLVARAAAEVPYLLSALPGEPAPLLLRASVRAAEGDLAAADADLNQAIALGAAPEPAERVRRFLAARR